MDDIWDKYIRNSKGWYQDSIANVHPRIYLGSARDVDIYTFSRLNITHVVNCAGEEHGSYWFKTEFPDRYACMNAEDSLDFDIVSVYPKFEETMNKFLSDPNCNRIYVHCQCGINRSAFLLLLYICIKFHYTPESAAKSILLQRPCCFRNTAFRKQVLDYIKKLD
jgi:hypothetical protein